MNRIVRNNLDFSRIPKLGSRGRRLVEKRVSSIMDFNALRLRHVGDDLMDYGKQIDTYHHYESMHNVWETYVKQKPRNIWKGPRVLYLFSYSKRDKSIYYPEVNSPSVHVGQQFYCMFGFGFPLGVVGMELINIDDQNHVIELAYIEGGLYRGVQYIKFIEGGQRMTRVEHVSYRKAENTLLDWLIPYAFLHSLTVGEFHKEMGNIINNRKQLTYEGKNQ